MPTHTSDGRVQKYLRRQKFSKSKVLKVLTSVMEKQAANQTGEHGSDYHSEFYNTGRIGRRNALPDILGYNCTTTTADLPDRLSALTTKDPQTSEPVASTSAAAAAAAATSTTGLLLDRNEPSTSQNCSNSTPLLDEDMNAT